MRMTVTATALCALLVATACSAPATTPPSSAGASVATAVPTATDGVEPSNGASVPPPPTTGQPSAPVSPPPSESPGPTSQPPPPPATGFDPGRVKVRLDPFVTGLEQPVAITHAGDGSGVLYVVERAGRVLVVEPTGTVRGQPLLDIRDRVDTQGERGLHYVVFHPGFETNGRFFVHWTDASSRSFIDEYRADAGSAMVARDSGRTILRIDHPDWNHKGGWMGFGPDGFMYIAVGDGGGSTPGDPFGNGQDRSDLLGNILRIDVDADRPYGIPSDNPFSGGNAEPEIWAFGLRNPWRASFDRETGDLWIGDVGQDTSEEVDVIPAGQGGLNFGWSDMEGRNCHNDRDCDPSRYTAPILTYGTRDEGCAVTGGYVYRGASSPLLVGGYIFSDYCTGTMWGLDAEAAMAAGEAELARLGSTPYNVVSLGEDEAGELYAVDFGGGVYRLTGVERN